MIPLEHTVEAFNYIKKRQAPVEQDWEQWFEEIGQHWVLILDQLAKYPRYKHTKLGKDICKLPLRKN